MWMGSRRRVAVHSVGPAWALPALSAQMKWDGKPPFIPSNIQATALGIASATRLWAGREHRICVSHGRRMCASPDPVSGLQTGPSDSDKGCFSCNKNKNETLSQEESTWMFGNVSVSLIVVIKSIKYHTFVYQSKSKWTKWPLYVSWLFLGGVEKVSPPPESAAGRAHAPMRPISIRGARTNRRARLVTCLKAPPVVNSSPRPHGRCEEVIALTLESCKSEVIRGRQEFNE